jgi:photosystem II stability/assembly factor-like uncharacterized protein
MSAQCGLWLVTLAMLWGGPLYALGLVPPFTDALLQHWYNRIYFAPSGVGYVADRHVLIRTLDAGRTWAEVPNPRHPPPSSIDRVAFLNESTFWIDGWGGLFRTTDGGQTFSQLVDEVRNLSDPARPLTTVGFSFIDADRGWAVAHDQWVRTTDGGQNWTTGHMFLPKYREVTHVLMFDAERGLAWGEVMVRSTNGGTNWRAPVQQAPPEAAEVRCIPAGFCVAVERPPTAAHFSTDFGETWRRTDTGIAAKKEPMADVQVVGMNDAVIVGQRELREYVVHEGRGPGVPTVTTRPSGPIVPDHAYLQRWDGTAWRRTEYPEIESFWAIHYVTATDVWASADTNGILHSTDGGQTWTFVPDYYRHVAARTPTPFVFPTPVPKP